ncbi:MAG: hypothetical protein LBO78_01285 [Rickettsiales bacterium]|jgi:23S rRNA (uracil1939-C5)-methyltransferase|nr:hypothetical protein [Rickettsiales bacterium]
MENTACGYFGKCGGCDSAHAPGKEAMLSRELEERGVPSGRMLPILRIPAGRRRRAELKVDYGANVGFFRARTNDVVPVASCPQLLPEIGALLPKLRALFRSLVERSFGAVEIVRVENGIVLRFEGIRTAPLDQPKIREFARANGIISISSESGILWEEETPRVSFGGREVAYPPGTFLQPSAEGEAAIFAAAKGFMEGKKYARVADLFSGLGLFSFGLAEAGRKISAYDCDRAAVRQINISANRYGLDVRAAEADLFRRPVRDGALSAFDLVILDPPRDGAEAEASELAKTSADIIYVSCNPATFARDAKILASGGYGIMEIQPVDQFPMTRHLELVARIKKLPP